MGEPKAITIEELREIIEATGAKLLTKEYINNRQHIEFLCSKCGGRGTITWKHYSRGHNRNFLCPSCVSKYKSDLTRESKTGHSIEELKEVFSKKGATLISTEYKSVNDPLKFLCSNCGKPWEIKLSVYKRGNNTDLLCKDCYYERQGRKKLTFADVQKYFLAGGSELLSKEYLSVDQKLKYKCVYCGGVGIYTLDRIKGRSEEKRFLCNDCLHGQRLKPQNNYGQKHHLYDLQWFKYIYEFYNLTADERQVYSAHHIKMYKNNPDYRTSFCNGYPLLIKYHDLGAVDPVTGKKNQFHVPTGYTNPTEFPEYAKLSYHNYPEFKFLDLNSVLITEIIAPNVAMKKNYLIDRFEHFKDRGILYIPFFFDELFILRRLKVACSIVRRVLYKWFSDIYNYTGQTVFYVDKIDSVEEIYVDTVKEFYNVNNLFGFIKSDYYIGCCSNGLLCCVMAFSVNETELVISGYTERCNTVCDTGMKCCLAYIQDRYRYINKMLFRFDARFEALYSNNLIENGFVKKNQTEPNLFYMSKRTNRFFKEMKKKADWIETMMDLGMSVEKVKSKQNNEFIEVFDLGDCEYVREKTE